MNDDLGPHGDKPTGIERDEWDWCVMQAEWEGDAPADYAEMTEAELEAAPF